MASVSALRWLVQPEVPGCPIPLIDRAIAIAARAWCDVTQTSREELIFDSVIGQQSYELTLESSDFDLARITSCTFGTSELTPKVSGTIRAKLDATGGLPRYFWCEGVTLWFDYVPQTVASIVLDVAVKPQVEASTIPDSAASGEASIAIAARAKRDLMMTKQAWGDPQAAAWYEAEFQRLVTNNINIADRNVTNAPIRVRGSA